jgi:hypothetical protein
MKLVMRRLSFAFLAVLSLFSTALTFFPQTAMAAGETYTWVDNNTIKVTGGNLPDHTFKLIAGSNPNRFIALPTAPLYQGKCYLTYWITLTSDSVATLQSPLPDKNAGPHAGHLDHPDCDAWNEVTDEESFPGVNAGYNGKTISIGGKRSGEQSESEADKDVFVTVNSPDPASSSPDSIKITIKDDQGKVVATSTSKQDAALGSADPNDDIYINPDSRPVLYNGDFHLEPGKYLVCADIVIQDCKHFTKEKFKPLQLEYGDDSTARQIQVHLKVTYIGGPKNLTVGPFDVILTKPGGGTVTVHTDTATHKMTPVEEASQGGGQINYSLSIDTRFTGLDPATYNICVDGVEECKDVKKVAGEVAEVTFTIDWLAFSENNQFERDCKDKYEVMNVRAITFLVCSVIDTGTFAVGALDDVIAKMLAIDVNDIFDDKAASNSYHIAWNSFRVFALGLIVIAALIMVVSQTVGVEVLDAYTVRKVLPRLLFAAIFIALSWDVLEFLATLSNDAAVGIRSLIYAPFKDLTSVGGSIGGGSLFALTLIGTGGALAFGWVGLLSFVVTGVAAALTALAVLVVRKIIIIILVIMAPFAIATGILPNTQKVYEFWKSTVGAMFIAGPIIFAFIATGRVMSAIAFSSPGSQTINQLIAFIAYFAPYFMISLAFKLSGGLMAKISGLAGQKSKGVSGRMRSFRSNKVQENMGKMATGDRFQGNNAIARGFNATTFGAVTAAKSKNKGVFLNPGNYFTGAGRKQIGIAREKVLEQRRMLNAMQYSKSPQAQVAAHRDMLNRAQTYANAAEALASMGQDFGMNEEQVRLAVDDAKANGGFGRNQQINAVQRLFATGTGFNDLPQAVHSINRVAGKNSEMAMSLIGEGNAVSGGVGRLDLKIGFGTYAQLYSSLQTNGALSEQEVDDAYMQAIEGNDVNEVVRGKPKASQNLAPVAARRMQTLKNTANNPNAGFDDQGRDRQKLATEEMGRLTGIIEKYNSTSNRWAAPVIKGTVSNDMVGTTQAGRDEVKARIQSGSQEAARGYNQQRPPGPGQI